MDSSQLIAPDMLIGEALKCAPDDLNDGAGLGLHPKWDSLAHIRVMMLLEQHYGVEIDDDSIKKFGSRDAIHARFREISGG
ncbi:MAG: acyl carrier protein [Rhodospirillales bacterium]